MNNEVEPLDEIDFEAEQPIIEIEEEMLENLTLDDYEVNIDNLNGNDFNDIVLEDIPQIVFISEDKISVITVDDGHTDHDYDMIKPPKQKPYKCEICGKGYKMKSYWKKHKLRCGQKESKFYFILKIDNGHGASLVFNNKKKQPAVPNLHHGLVQLKPSRLH